MGPHSFHTNSVTNQKQGLCHGYAASTLVGGDCRYRPVVPEQLPIRVIFLFHQLPQITERIVRRGRLLRLRQYIDVTSILIAGMLIVVTVDA